jgi:hypothetical protein
MSLLRFAIFVFLAAGECLKAAVEDEEALAPELPAKDDGIRFKRVFINDTDLEAVCNDGSPGEASTCCSCKGHVWVRTICCSATCLHGPFRPVSPILSNRRCILFQGWSGAQWFAVGYSFPRRRLVL